MAIIGIAINTVYNNGYGESVDQPEPCFTAGEQDDLFDGSEGW